MNKKNWTGERLETFVFNQSTIEHLHRYAIASEYCTNKDVLDIACGEGYGTNILSKIAKSVVGVDISESVIQNAKQQYQRPNLTFSVGRADEIPCKSGTFDVVVSFETIEHHDKHHEMLREVKRVLKPGGIFIISSPDKKFYSDIPAYSNPFHVKELYESEFRSLITSYFKFASFASQRAGYFSVVLPENPVSMKIYGGSYNEVSQLPKLGPVYWIAIASDNEFSQKIEVPLFEGDSIIKKFKTEAQDKIKRSKPYRLGRLILLPIFLLQNFFNAKPKS